MIFRRFLSIPKQGLFNMNNAKQLIFIQGPDSLKFLNGLTTSKLVPSFIKKNEYTISDRDDGVNPLQITDEELHRNWGIIHEDSFLENDDEDKVGIRRDGIYSMLLNSKGRVLSDLFIYPTPFNFIDKDEPSYLLELDKSVMGKVLMMMKLHKLKSNLQITKLEGVNIWYYYNESLQFNQLLSILEENYFNNQSNKSPKQSLQSSQFFIDNELIFNKNLPLLGFAIDNRSYLNGIKFITPTSDTSSIFNTDFTELIKPDLQQQDLQLYHLRNNLKGLVEKKDVGKLESLPFEHNIDFMNGISYDKGCYVGQELTIRTKNHGTIRKRIFPFKVLTNSTDDVDENFNKDLTNLEISLPVLLSNSPFGTTSATRERKQTVGKILSMTHNVGYILLNLQFVQDMQDYKDLEIDGVQLRIWKPDYFVDENDDDEFDDDDDDE